MENVQNTLREKALHTVCQGALCPNRTDCWARGALAFQILGDVCSRMCAFCGQRRGKPLSPDPGEPARLAEAVGRLALRHVVITSPTRDDLPDGGAEHFVSCFRAVRRRLPHVTVELLIPDFQGRGDLLNSVFQARPDVLNHNVETVRRLTPALRPQASYERSLYVLKESSRAALWTKSGLMVGLGERRDEISRTLADLKEAGVRTVTVGQYLPPGPSSHPVERFYTPQEFADIHREAQSQFEQVMAGPLVRSSYHADKLVDKGIRR